MDIQLQEGLRAYPLDLGEQNPRVGWREVELPTVEQAKIKLDSLFRSIEDQGGEVKCFVTVDTGYKDGGVIGGVRPETTTFIVVEKREA